MLLVLVLLVCKLNSDGAIYTTRDTNFCSGFIGFPSVGKSTLMSRLTGQHSEGQFQAMIPALSNTDTTL